MSLLILAVTVIFAKHFYSKWKKRPKNVKKEVEQEEQIENKDQNENVTESGITQMPKVSNENPIELEMKAAEIQKISTSEEKPTPQKRKLRKR
uniref:Uncharacterized protein n=1 Tax=Panagrolaimus sp. ES5 TaxID=591445 RepID=A0AC34FUL8_9BILA